MSGTLSDDQLICLQNAVANLKEAAHMIDKLLRENRDDGDFGEVINRCNWAVDYLYRAKGAQ